MNWGQLKAAVAAYLEAGSAEFVANYPLYARLAEEDIYRSVQLPVAQQTSTSTIFNGVPYLGLPSDWLATYSIRVVANGENHFLLPKDASYLAEAYGPADTGRPRFYAIFDSLNLIVAPVPDTNYATTMRYFKIPTSISAANDNATTWLSTYAENAMLFGMLYHAYVFEKGDQDVIQSYKGQFDKALADLKVIAEGRNKKDTNRIPDQRIPT